MYVMLIHGPAKSSSSSNLRRLALLRVLLLVAALLVVMGAHFVADIQLPLAPLLIVFALMALACLWIYRRAGSGATINDREFFLHLCVDVLALSAVLYYTGGGHQPLCLAYLFYRLLSPLLYCLHRPPG